MDTEGSRSISSSVMGTVTDHFKYWSSKVRVDRRLFQKVVWVDSKLRFLGIREYIRISLFIKRLLWENVKAYKKRSV